MEEYKNLVLERDGALLTITINRESKLNALNQETLAELKEAFQGIYEDHDIRGVILTGAGEKAFVAGADISEFQGVNEVNGRKFSEAGQEIFQMIEECHTPVIAVVGGFALGGGCELAMACHMRVAAKAAKFGQPEVNLGIIPGYGGTQRLTQLIGKGKSLEYSMTGDMIDADTALQWGLVNHIGEDKDAAMQIAQSMLGKIGQKAPIAIEMVINSINAYYKEGEDGYQAEAKAFSKCCGTEDFKEGAAAFIEKRKPNFQGK